MLIVPHFEINNRKSESGVLLPEDFEEELSPYIEATVIDIADDCHSQFKHLKFGNIDFNKIVVDRSMIQKVQLKENSHYLILENYVVGMYRRP